MRRVAVDQTGLLEELKGSLYPHNPPFGAIEVDLSTLTPTSDDSVGAQEGQLPPHRSPPRSAAWQKQKAPATNGTKPKKPGQRPHSNMKAMVKNLTGEAPSFGIPLEAFQHADCPREEEAV